MPSWSSRASSRSRAGTCESPGCRASSTARPLLSLSGHTHGGQVTAFGHALVVPSGSGSFVAGCYETTLGPLYVNRGIGTSVVAARFCARPELALFRLRRGDVARLTEAS